MINKVFHNIVDKMGTLIGHDCQWTSKSCKNMFVQKLGSYCNNIGAKSSCFHPLGCIINGHQNALVAQPENFSLGGTIRKRIIL
jgi:hypothetical protein